MPIRPPLNCDITAAASRHDVKRCFEYYGFATKWNKRMRKKSEKILRVGGVLHYGENPFIKQPFDITVRQKWFIYAMDFIRLVKSRRM